MSTEFNIANDKRPKRMALLWAYPALRKLPYAEWDEVLKQAKKTEFDMIERIWTLAGLAAVTYLLRLEPDQAADLSLPMLYLSQFVVAVPLVILIVGPAYLRCLRRGLDGVIEHRHLAG